MKSSIKHSLFAEERKEELTRLLKSETFLSVPALCEYFQVSASTIRNDIKELSDAKQLQRVHGGVVPVQNARFEADIQYKSTQHNRIKAKIGAKASEFVSDGDTIILDAGSTSYELARNLLERKRLTIVVNDLNIALYLEKTTDANVILLSGFLKKGQSCTAGPWAVETLSSLNVDTAFISANSFAFSRGFMTPDIQQAELKKSFISASSQIIMMLDSSKIGQFSFITFADLKDMDILIMDQLVSEQDRCTFDLQAGSIEFHYV